MFFAWAVVACAALGFCVARNVTDLNTYGIVLACVGAIAIALFLTGVWNPRAYCWFAFTQLPMPGALSLLTKADFVFVEPMPNCGRSAIVPLQREQVPENDEESTFFFLYQQTKFIFDVNSGDFISIPYPDNLSFRSYLSRGGLSTNAVSRALGQYAGNVLRIPEPAFMELFKEHASAPFFVFQMFCVFLWCLDDYWYMSLFTLFMLIIFECMLVKQRQRDLQRLRAMRRPAININVYRGNRWEVRSSAELVPGDLISVCANSRSARRRGDDVEGTQCPCDVLLLTGSCIVNESLLTGESIPVLKENVSAGFTASAFEPTTTLDINKLAHKRHVVWAGTQVIQHGNAPSSNKVERATLGTPDAGCLAVVVRTGYGTTQGRLLRTILFASERVSANNREAFMFIGAMMVFAVMASAYVLVNGLKDEKRSRWKLFLHCVMIITSVVPPELPIELSLVKCLLNYCLPESICLLLFFLPILKFVTIFSHSNRTPIPYRHSGRDH